MFRLYLRCIYQIHILFEIRFPVPPELTLLGSNNLIMGPSPCIFSQFPINSFKETEMNISQCFPNSQKIRRSTYRAIRTFSAYRGVREDVRDNTNNLQGMELNHKYMQINDLQRKKD